MSGIAGIYNLDGRPVDPDLLRRMTDVIAERGPDASGHWIDGPVGLGHRMLYTTPESLREKQPLTDETGNLCLVLDGRVDNREELKAALEARGARLRDDTDAEMVLQAYECWGEECPLKIIGDFAFVVWDKRKRQLFCARDIIGIKPFYFHADNHRFLFGSDLLPLFADATTRREPNEGMIGEYLASAITNNEETLYQDIFRLPPSHYLIVGPSQLQKKRYWDIDPAKEIWCETDEEYAEHFFEIFREAVQARLRCCGTCGAYLSGGLDSSSIVGVAQSFYSHEALADADFETFSLVFPQFPCDESAYIQDVVRMWGIRCNAMCPAESEASYYAEHVGRYYDFPDYPNGAMRYPLNALAREKGVRVLLTGYGGDEWLTSGLYHYADLLRRLKILSLMRQVRFDSSLPANTVPLFEVLKLSLLPLLPLSARRAIRRGVRQYVVPRWMEPRFARGIQLASRLREETPKRQFSSVAQQGLCNKLNSGWQIHILEMEERTYSWFGLEQRHPFHDRRVIEFALGLPESQRWRQGQTKFVLRQAMRGLIPETVRQRLAKADFSHVFVKALQIQGGERLFDSLRIALMGWIDVKQVRVMYRQMAHLYAQGDEGYITYVWPLWMVFGIELWFNTVFVNGDGLQ